MYRVSSSRVVCVVSPVHVFSVLVFLLVEVYGAFRRKENSMALDDKNYTPTRNEPQPNEMWTPFDTCKKETKHCIDTSFGAGQPCNWCGRHEDGTYD